MERNNYIVYMHINKTPSIDNIYKKYIGLTRQSVEKRWKLGKGYKKKNKNNRYTYFYQAIEKYGWDNFEHKILIHGLTEEQAKKWETKLIKHYKSNNKKYGYNCTEGGETNLCNEETRKKLRIANTGKHHSQETKDKLSKIFKGCKNPKISQSLKKYFKTHESSAKNKKASLESRKKMSEAKKGKPSPKKGVKLNKQQLHNLRNTSKLATKIVCLDTLQVFISQTYCAEILNISHKHICSVCKGKRNHTFGYHFDYLENFKLKYPEMVDKLIYM